MVDVKPSFDQKYLLLYTDSTAGRLIIIDAETGQLVRDLWGTVVDGYDHSKCCWDATGERVFATSGDGKIWVFEVSSGKVLCKLEGHEGGIRGVYWDLEANWLVSCGYDQTVRVWSA